MILLTTIDGAKARMRCRLSVFTNVGRNFLQKIHKYVQSGNKERCCYKEHAHFLLQSKVPIQFSRFHDFRGWDKFFWNR